VKKSFLLLLMTALPLLSQDATVTIDTNSKLLTSTFHIGTTHTHGYWEYGHADAVNRAKALLMDGVTFQNQHIMGWGAGNPNPEPGVFSWDNLDHRVELMRSIDTPMFITFCQAPGWMKGDDDWAMDQDVLDEYVDDFAELCQRTAERFDDVDYFHVWNELKGYWSSSLNNWDYERYTAMYNAVYTAVKAVRPDAKLGGPYIVIQGDGAVNIGKSGRDTHVPIDSRDKKVLSYWLENNVGADFICADYSLPDYHDPNSYTHDELMQLTPMYGKWISDIRGMTDLPIVISEFYAGADADDWEFTAANYASCFNHALINGASIALQWNPEEGELKSFLFTDTDKADGGQPTPLYFVIKAINDFFSTGTDIVTSTSSSDWIEVLASENKTMLINKKDESVTVDVNGQSVELKRYGVKVIDTPAGTGIEHKTDNQETSSIETRYTPNGPEIYVTPVRSTEATIHVYNLLGQSVYEFSQPLVAHNENIIRFKNSNLLSRGAYFVRVKGLERPFVKQIQVQ
jgi:hypothetical protein